MCLENNDKIFLKSGQTIGSAVNELPITAMAKMLGKYYLRECIVSQIDEGNITVVTNKSGDDMPWVNYPSPASLADIEKHFDSGGSLAVEIPDCTEPECDGKCCTTYSDMAEFTQCCGDSFSDYDSDDFESMHLIPKF